MHGNHLKLFDIEKPVHQGYEMKKINDLAKNGRLGYELGCSPSILPPKIKSNILKYQEKKGGELEGTT